MSTHTTSGPRRPAWYGAPPGKDGPRFVQPGRRRLDERPRRVLRAEQPLGVAVGDEQQPVVGG